VSRGGVAAAVVVALLAGGCAGRDERAPPVAAEPAIDPASLIGLDAAALRARLGAPEFVRQEKAAEVWRYAYGACIAYLFLYADNGAARKPPTVRFIEVRGLASPSVKAEDCIGRPAAAPPPPVAATS